MSYTVPTYNNIDEIPKTYTVHGRTYTFYKIFDQSAPYPYKSIAVRNLHNKGKDVYVREINIKKFPMLAIYIKDYEEGEKEIVDKVREEYSEFFNDYSKDRKHKKLSAKPKRKPVKKCKCRK